MSSKEIAELTGKRHDNVLRDIRNMLVALRDDPSSNLSSEEYQILRAENGLVSETLLNKRLSYVLVTGYSVPLRAAVITRWQQLEDGLAQHRIPQTFAEALRLAAETQEKADRLQADLEEAAPKVAVFERIAVADGGVCISKAAKMIQVRPSDLFAYLRQNRWIFRRPTNEFDTAYQDRIEAGYVVHKVVPLGEKDGHQKLKDQVLITPKGITKLAAIVPNWVNVHRKVAA
jgi:phage antirepressor YoqD-like protein